MRDQEPLDPELTCKICKKLVWEAVRTPCCSSAFCEECITTKLVENSFECPVCESKVASLAKLAPDMELRERVKGYVSGEIERSKKEEKEEKEEKGEAAGENGEEGAEGAVVKVSSCSNQQSFGADEQIEDGDAAAEGSAAKTESGADGQSRPENAAAAAEETKPGAQLDATRMQEMLNPNTMQIYLSQVSSSAVA